jgi:hypothetical protein
MLSWNNMRGGEQRASGGGSTLSHSARWNRGVEHRYDYHYSLMTPFMLISTKYPVHDLLCFPWYRMRSNRIHTRLETFFANLIECERDKNVGCA